MNKIDLKNKLKAENVSGSIYSLDGGLPHKKYALILMESFGLYIILNEGGVLELKSFHQKKMLANIYMMQ